MRRWCRKNRTERDKANSLRNEKKANTRQSFFLWFGASILRAVLVRLWNKICARLGCFLRHQKRLIFGCTCSIKRSAEGKWCAVQKIPLKKLLPRLQQYSLKELKNGKWNFRGYFCRLYTASVSGVWFQLPSGAHGGRGWRLWTTSTRPQIVPGRRTHRRQGETRRRFCRSERSAKTQRVRLR